VANENLIVDSDLGVEQKVMGLLACLAQEQKARIDRLIGETKRRSHEDQRRVLVSITEAGEHAHVAADERLIGMSTGLSEGELQQLYELLLKL